MPRPRKQRTPTEEIEEMRSRHVHCISGAVVLMDIREGRVPNYWKHPDKYKPICGYPDDPVCAAPDITTDSLIKEMEKKRSEEADS